MTEKENNEGIGADLFDEVSRTINYDRQDQYGNPEDCFASIARRWTEYLRKIGL